MIGITSTDEEIVQGARRLLSSSEEDEGQIFKEPKDTNRPSKGASKAKKPVSNAIKQFQGSSKQKNVSNTIGLFQPITLIFFPQRGIQ